MVGPSMPSICVKIEGKRDPANDQLWVTGRTAEEAQKKRREFAGKKFPLERDPDVWIPGFFRLWPSQRRYLFFFDA